MSSLERNLPQKPSSLVPPIEFREREPLPLSFYETGTLDVARKILGKGLLIESEGDLMVTEIVEVEAYLGTKDAASHAFKGLTRRNGAMFERGGTCYVYLSYGFHFCMNVTTQCKGIGEAVLIRALRPIYGLEAIRTRRPLVMKESGLLNGPGKLTEGLGINLTYNGFTFDRPDFKIIDLGTKVPSKLIGQSPRIGISKAAEKPWRFFIKGSPWLSRKG